MLLVKHGKGHWAFPKGHPEPGESHQETAERELEEETGLRVKRLLFSEPIQEQYHFQDRGRLIYKEVTYYIAEVSGKVKLQAEEISDYKWATIEESFSLITFNEGKKLIEKTKLLLDSVERTMK